MGEGECKVLEKGALTPLVSHSLSLLCGFILTRQWGFTPITLLLTLHLSLAFLGPSSSMPLLSIMPLQYFLGFGSGLLGSLLGGVVDELACCAICDSSILL